MKNMQIIEKVELIRCLQDLIESNNFSTEDNKIFRKMLLEIVKAIAV